jgi:hypothetical protein
MNELAERLAVVVEDPGSWRWLRSSRRVAVLRGAQPGVAQRASNLLVLARASRLDRVAELVREARARHRLRGLLVRTDTGSRWAQQMLDRAGLRTSRRLLLHEGDVVPRRVLDAWRMGAQDALIADAMALGDRLLVLSCALERIEVPVDRIGALRSIGRVALGRFRIASDGAYLHWPEPDVHLDLEALRLAVDPGLRDGLIADRVRHGRRFGRAVAALRARRGIRQVDVAGLSTRQLRRIESGEVVPRVTTLGKLAIAHGMELAEYVDALARLAGEAGTIGARGRGP